MNESILGNFRSAACWLTIAMALWSLTYYYTYGTTEGSDWIIQDLSVTVSVCPSVFSVLTKKHERFDLLF